MRPVYMYVSFISINENAEKITYGSSLFEFTKPHTLNEIRELIRERVKEKYLNDVTDTQIMNVTFLKKKQYKMLQGIK